MPRSHPRIEIKTPEQIALMRGAGLVVAKALATMRAAVAPGVSTAELDAIAHDVIRSAGAVPSFLGYQGYPATICSSVNEQIVHAIPSPRQVLREGDLISIDCGAILDGWHGDAAISVIVGSGTGSESGTAPKPELTKLINAAEEALWAGITTAAKAMRSGGGRLGDISAAIEKSSRQTKRYGIVRGYGGHGIGTEMHMEPFVLNYGRPGRGPHLVPGMCLAIEPMLTLGSPRTLELADEWTVVTADRSVAAHVEHTVGLFDDGVWVLTADDGGAARLGELLTAAAGSRVV
ncbi:type I methionyl aminopeptidase [Virgisporangium aurantiacum]|uniref:Methionine aminopeptidase n=1 Tax=Virgisporangium aurantiacum TaxID=175570 RepID=A0A8J3ZBH7_9ACTN|nr:type I methionyl aminopeptidase [Virgisporangium aurantiacum]GIJ58695.1 methionine aminopeptidase [Virgisporangium aurantiacum]